MCLHARWAHNLVSVLNIAVAELLDPCPDVEAISQVQEKLLQMRRRGDDTEGAALLSHPVATAELTMHRAASPVIVHFWRPDPAVVRIASGSCTAASSARVLGSRVW